ncbi:MAG: glycoside hydrolase family 32 protein, partial [Bacillus sp. (in: Bacteria)]|nr:glycoside hydrolase family 32 protein [Bacillus sp. (in: firmicutes)]
TTINSINDWIGACKMNHTEKKEEHMKQIRQANEAVAAASESAKHDEYRLQYHVMPPGGWMNDPNGHVHFKGEYHLFYQHHPYSDKWGPMHWGHAVSSDLIKWKHKEIALKPGQFYDKNGIFSGSGIQVGNEHWLYYTGHIDKYLDQVFDEFNLKRPNPGSESANPFIRQVQCLAKSVDGENYQKYENNPVIETEQIPAGIKIEDFRDPKVWRHEGTFYLVVGARSTDEIGYVLFYVSKDGIEWDYLNQYSLGRDYGTVWECPDLFELDGKHVLLFSPQDKPRVGNSFENVHSTIALIGSFDYATGDFTLEHGQELDQGFDFYAPQSTLTKDGKRVLIAWMNMWDIDYPLHKLDHGWNGSVTLPRQLTIKNGKLLQTPYHTIEKYKQFPVEFNDFEVSGEYKNSALNGNCQQIDIEFVMTNSDKFVMEFFKGEKENISLNFNKTKNEVTLNRIKSEYRIDSLVVKNDYVRSQSLDLSKKVKLSIFLDVSSIEIFINGGEQVFTSLFFSKELSEGVNLHSNGTVYVEKLTKWEIN